MKKVLKLLSFLGIFALLTTTTFADWNTDGYFENPIGTDYIRVIDDFAIGDTGDEISALHVTDLYVTGAFTFGGTMASDLDMDGNKIYNGFAELTPDVTITSDTNDGSTKPLVVNDSDDAEVFSIDSDGDLSLNGNFTADSSLIVDDILYLSGQFGAGTNIDTVKDATGTMMFWYPRKAAFRAGDVTGTQWDDANIGDYSVAFGRDSQASGEESLAIGSNTVSSGEDAVGIGPDITASGFKSFAAGTNITAAGIRAIAVGQNQAINSAASDGVLVGASSVISASGGLSMGLGYFLNPQASGAHLIGSGVDSSNRMINTTANSIGFGVNTTTPTMYLTDNDNLLIGTDDDDGTPEAGRLVVKGDTNDGSTNIFVGRDSDEANVLTINTDGDISAQDITGTTLTDGTASLSAGALSGLTTIGHSGVLTASGAHDITIADGGNDVALTVTQNDTTNNPNAVEVTNTGTGDSLAINTSDFVVESDGKVLIGKSTATYGIDKLSVAGNTNNVYFGLENYNTDNTKAAVVQLRKSGNAAIGSHTATVDGEVLGAYAALGNTGSGFQWGSSIATIQDGAVGTYVPTDILFQVSTASSILDEAMRIKSDGNVGIGTDSPQIFDSATNRYLTVSKADSSGAAILDLDNDLSTDNSLVGSIFWSNSNNSSGAVDANGKITAVIDSRIETSDNNADDDSGGNLIFITKEEAVSSSEKMRITGDGKVGIGTVSPDYALDVAGTMGVDSYIYHNGDADTYSLFENDRVRTYAGGEQLLDLFEGAQDYVKLGDGGDVDINLNDNLFVQGSDGKVGINNSSPAVTLDVYPEDGVDYALGAFRTIGNTTARSSVTFYKARGSVGSLSNIATNDNLGQIAMAGYYGGDYRVVSSIDVAAEGTWSSGSYPSKMIFTTTNSGDSARSTKMVIDSDGKLGIGTNSPDTQLHTTGGRSRNVTTVNAATYDLLVTDDILNVTYTGTAAVTSLTLPTAQTTAGRTIVIKDAGGNAGTNNITVDTEGAETIDGAATAVISGDYDAINLYSDGSNWFIF